MRRFLVIAVTSIHLAVAGSLAFAAPSPAPACFDSSFAGESAFLSLQRSLPGS